jgi:phage-related baseplate assembly protein
MPTLIDFARLGLPATIEALDYEAQLAAAKAKLIELLPEWDVSAVESDPANKIMEVCAYLDLLLRARVNDGIKAQLLAYAAGAALDQLAANVGVTRLSGESDTALRLRAQQAWWSTASAGPAGAYRWHAMSASADVVNVGVHSPQPGHVHVVVLGKEWVYDTDDDRLDWGAHLWGTTRNGNNLLPVPLTDDSALIDTVRGALSQEDVMPLTDTVSVLAVDIQPVPIDATLTLYPGPDADLLIADARAALDAYLASIHKVGYDLTRAGIVDALVVPGVQNVTLTSPAEDVVVGPYGMTVSPEIAVAVAEARDV